MTSQLRSKLGLLGALVFLSSNIQADVDLEQPGHQLIQRVDSGSPLHASQGLLDTDCLFGDSGNIESIAVDPSANLYVQLTDGSGDPSSNSCLFSINTGGMVTTINPDTGFGINSRGTDLLYDSAGRLLTLDTRFSTNGRIATVSLPSGTTGTYAEFPNGNFFGGTLGMQFSPGGGDVSSGELVFTSDSAANGIWSSPFGGPVANHVTPPAPGDDMVIQPDGDWVHVGDGDDITVFDPDLPHSSWTSPLDVADLFLNRSLPFIFGTRSTVCDYTGDVYISFSGVTGGTGIVRLNEALTDSELLVSISGTEGLHDMVIGPSGNSGGQSMYFTVHDTFTDTEEVWELTLPDCERAEPVPVDSRWALLSLVVLLLGFGLFARSHRITV